VVKLGITPNSKNGRLEKPQVLGYKDSRDFRDYLFQG